LGRRGRRRAGGRPRVHLVVGGVVGGHGGDAAGLEDAAEQVRRGRRGEAAAGRGDPQQRAHAAEALVEVGGLVQRVAVPREVPLAADVLRGDAGGQGALVPQVRAAAVPGVGVLEEHVAVVRRRHRQRVGGRVPLVRVVPPQQEVLGGAGGDG